MIAFAQGCVPLHHGVRVEAIIRADLHLVFNDAIVADHRGGMDARAGMNDSRGRNGHGLITPMNMSGYTVSELAGLCEGRAEGDTPGSLDRRITGVASPEGAKVHHLVFAESDKDEKHALESAAGCVVVRIETAAPGRTVIRHTDPKLAFARLAARLHPPSRPAAGVHAQAA